MAKPARTIGGLRLDVEAAQAGRTWLLLPEGFRAQECGKTYPLPSTLAELRTLALLYTPGPKRDCGCVYLHRAFEAVRRRQQARENTLLTVERQAHEVTQAHAEFKVTLAGLQREASAAVSTVQTHAEQAVANLDHLFALGRRGIEGQMQAHLAGTEWQGERINARAFRECFWKVSQIVKGLGLPTGEREAAGKTIVDQLAASLEAMKDALTHAKPLETEH